MAEPVLHRAQAKAAKAAAAAQAKQEKAEAAEKLKAEKEEAHSQARGHEMENGCVDRLFFSLRAGSDS